VGISTIAVSLPTNRHRVAGFLAFLGAALLAFNDIAPLRAIGGGLLASPGWVPLVIATALVFNDAKTPLTKTILKSLLLVLSLGCLVSVATLPFLPEQLLGESPTTKAIKLLITMAAWCTIFLGAGLLLRTVRTWLLAGLLTAVAIMAVSAFLGQLGFGVFENLGFFHGTQNGQMRLRGTRFEASSLGAGLICSLSAFAMVLRGRRALVMMAAGFLAVQFLSRSRGTWVTVVLVLVAIGILYVVGKRITRTKSWAARVLPWASVVTTLSLSFGLSFLVTSDMWVDLGLADGSGMRSETTRSVWAATTAMSLLNFPLGMGFAGYLNWLPEILSQATTQNSGSFYTADFSELLAIINSSDDTLLSPKTLPGLLIIFFGWVGAAASVALSFLAVRGGLNLSRSGFLAAPAAAFAVLLVSFTFASSVFSWDQALILGWFVAASKEQIEAHESDLKDVRPTPNIPAKAPLIRRQI
jgi:hypothetical protein